MRGGEEGGEEEGGRRGGEQERTGRRLEDIGEISMRRGIRRGMSKAKVGS
jgi:hypothetical protein